ncbi:Polypyrimidine tract-binding protein -like protein 3 [Capsicum baccatum]|uniref:Polypyrimidine tract-binding protein-like protein 3 n=1 Tax=Capsicum baccatum TaxID=33114 RepID=A0A2G2WYG7_CAPBA|nr:Polypyrimidine tract-binding protein -like protein 3 [Capsicum baccatum]
MQDIASAVNAIQFYSNVQPSIRGRNVYVQFSSHQELTTVEQSSQGRGDELELLKRYDFRGIEGHAECKYR